MKNYFLNKRILVALVAVLGYSAYAQTPEQRAEIVKNYDLVALQELSEKFAKEQKENYALALIEANKRNMPTIIEDENSYSELVGIHENGDLIYYTTSNQGAAITSNINMLNTGGGLGLDLNGQNMIAGVWDQNVPSVSHNDFGERVQVLDGATTSTSLHSTHVTGTIAGSGANNFQARGMAYQANVYALDWNNDYNEMADVASFGVLVSNHSYGQIAGQLSENQFGAYNNRSRQLDQLAFLAPNYLSVHAAGNDRNDGINPTKNGYDLINGNKTSKNSLVVAAVNQVDNYTGPASVLMSNFSSWGPTDDNRIKPDISAKGVNVLSLSNVGAVGYSTLSGTSMASPVVTGGIVLLQQHYSNTNAFLFMRASTVRALVCHSALEAGPNPGPDPMFGWGLFDASKAAQIITETETDFALIDELTLNNGSTYSVTVGSIGQEPLIATIAWTDPAGLANNSVIDLATPVLVNDLDIRIFKDGAEYLPWKLGSTHTSPAENGDNNVDNIEKIEINNPQPGNYQIVVSHKGNLLGGSQDFGLIVSGKNDVLNNDVFAAQDFNIYPNPTRNNVVVDFNGGNFESIHYDVFDMIGRRVLSSEVNLQNNTSFILDLSNMMSGSYILNITSEGKKLMSKKIIKI